MPTTARGYRELKKCFIGKTASVVIEDCPVHTNSRMESVGTSKKKTVACQIYLSEFTRGDVT